MTDADFSSLDNSHNSETLHTATPEEFLSPLGNWATWGGLVLLATFAGTIYLASILKYKVTVKVPAVVRPVGELHLVQSAIAGQVNSIEVKVNQSVELGQAIAYLDDSRLQIKKSQLQGNIEQGKRQINQILVQIQAIERQIAAETDRLKRSIALAQAELNLSQRQYQDKKVTATAELKAASANLQQAKESWQKAQADLKSAQAELTAREMALASAMVKRDRYKSAAAAGALSQAQLEEVELAVQQERQALESQKAIVEGQKNIVQRQQRAIEASQARRRVTSTALNPSEANLTMIKEKIAREQAIGEASLARLNQERESLIQQQVSLENRLNSDRQELQQIETELQETIIRATTTGTIQQLNLRNPGQTIQSGAEIATIAPSNAVLQFKTAVSSQDIRQVEVGQRVKIRVSACPYPDYGTLAGTVSAIAPDANIPETNSSGGASYNVTIKPANLTLNAGERNCTIKSGMEGRADIISREQTALQFILRKARLLVDL